MHIRIMKEFSKEKRDRNSTKEKPPHTIFPTMH